MSKMHAMTRFQGGGAPQNNLLKGFLLNRRIFRKNIITNSARGTKGFTLAETLVTLGIIGIVAAMTLPAVVGKWQKTVHINQMKHTYSVIANAFQMSMQDNGNPKEWDWGTEQSYANLERVVETYLIPYLNLDTKNTKQPGQYNHYYAARLKNGTTLSFVLDGCTNANTCNPISITTLYIIVSTKGNVLPMSDTSRDYSREDFILKFSKSSAKLEFFNSGNNTREGLKNNYIYACNKNIAKNMRYNCGALIFYDGWEIKDDYPW